ncbi:fibroblast growth factor 1 isoform X3 [Vulpes lagopus]|uniref:fibroblast growth factor 1 isoform X3 n=1 Tax=Vulpes lagopus TaxID=494514 RepID=UPI001BC9348C|nr:fibroblast growth factor 1 isoform X3 [Vulpes lagopus]
MPAGLPRRLAADRTSLWESSLSYRGTNQPNFLGTSLSGKKKAIRFLKITICPSRSSHASQAGALNTPPHPHPGPSRLIIKSSTPRLASCPCSSPKEGKCGDLHRPGGDRDRGRAQGVILQHAGGCSAAAQRGKRGGGVYKEHRDWPVLGHGHRWASVRLNTK